MAEPEPEPELFEFDDEPEPEPEPEPADRRSTPAGSIRISSTSRPSSTRPRALSRRRPSDDVLEGTPEFLEETPEHDRLWFEQRPPRDFDFDD